MREANVGSLDHDRTGAGTAVIDEAELEANLTDMYRHVGELPHGDFHFEMGRSLVVPPVSPSVLGRAAARRWGR